MSRHARDPFKLDLECDWEGIVQFDRVHKDFIRCLDRYGEQWEKIE